MTRATTSISMTSMPMTGTPGDQEMAAEHDDQAGLGPGAGPWDSRERYPQRQRVDLGSLLIPVNPDQEVQLNVAGEQIVAASVTFSDSALQVQAFARPRAAGCGTTSGTRSPEEIAQRRRPIAAGGGPVRHRAGGPRAHRAGRRACGPAASPLHRRGRAALAAPGHDQRPGRQPCRAGQAAGGGLRRHRRGARRPPGPATRPAGNPAARRDARGDRRGWRRPRSAASSPNPFDRGPEITETR